MKKIILFIFLFSLFIPFNVQAQDIEECDRVEYIQVWEEAKPDDYVFVQLQHYSLSTGKIVCWDACWHEVGHKLDYEVMDRVSQSDEFHEEVVNFLYIQMFLVEEPHPMTVDILLFPGFFTDYHIFSDDAGDWAGYVWGGYEELYAEILDWSQGDIEAIPQNLQEFYDMDAATQMYNQVAP